jgi:intracellular sulfur oxidation DsrE/DsrF family protein
MSGMNARRSFFSRLGFAVAALGTTAAAQQPDAGSAKASAERWQPARDAKDDWFDQVPGKHRLFFDTLTDRGLREARLFANNYLDANKTGYGLEPSDLAVVMCLRHDSTLFAFGDPFWAKYGTAMAESLKLADPKQAVNPQRAQLDALAKRGVQFAVCDVASHHYATMIARKMDAGADAIYKEMTAHLIGNARFVPAGIVAVQRAQERGYSIAYTG